MVYAVVAKPKGFVRRGRFEIINEILTLCKTPTQKTHILYKCNLSYDQIQKYLSFLVENNLLTFFENEGKSFYRTTELGENFLEEHQRVVYFLNKSKR